jgi:hypothetical protein
VTPGSAGSLPEQPQQQAAAPPPTGAGASPPTELQPAPLPAELCSSVQRTLKGLAEPPPAQPLTSGVLPAAAWRQQQRAEEADR